MEITRAESLLSRVHQLIFQSVNTLKLKQYDHSFLGHVETICFLEIIYFDSVVTAIFQLTIDN